LGKDLILRLTKKDDILTRSAARPIYDKGQIAAYLDTISLPQKHRSSPIFSNHSLARTLTHGLPLISVLQKYQLAAIPFENLGLHYAFPFPTVNIAPEAVYSRSVDLKCGRGGRCMEINNLFYHVLLSLGFDVVTVGGRVNEVVQPLSAKKDWPGPRYDGWNHRITLVKFADGRAETTGASAGAKKRVFLVDVGFRSQMPTKPIELIKGSGREDGQTILNVPPDQESRVRWTGAPDTVDKEQEMWVYEIKYGEGK
jgi:arylamine N-acetyltransferase